MSVSIGSKEVKVFPAKGRDDEVIHVWWDAGIAYCGRTVTRGRAELYNFEDVTCTGCKGEIEREGVKIKGLTKEKEPRFTQEKGKE